MTYLPAMKLYTIKIIDWCDLIEVMCDSHCIYICIHIYDYFSILHDDAFYPPKISKYSRCNRSVSASSTDFEELQRCSNRFTSLRFAEKIGGIVSGKDGGCLQNVDN